VKHGSGPRPAAHIAKRHFLKWLETSFKFCFYLPFCTASVEIACVFLQFVFVLHSSGPRTLSQVSNTMVVKDGSGPRPAAHNTKYYLLNWLKTSFIFFPFSSNSNSNSNPKRRSKLQIIPNFTWSPFA
jgi:hypothetical protein